MDVRCTMEVEHHVKACTKKTVLRIVSANRKLLEKPPSLSKGGRPDLGALFQHFS